MAKINVKDTEITIISVEERDYISLTDMANAKEGESRAADIIKNWIRTRYTLEFLGTWEQINNPNFKVVEFDHFKMQAGLPSFVLSVSEWIEKTNAIGIIVRKGKYGGTYAHKDIAFEFGSAISVPEKNGTRGKEDGEAVDLKLRVVENISLHQDGDHFLPQFSEKIHALNTVLARSRTRWSRRFQIHQRRFI